MLLTLTWLTLLELMVFPASARMVVHRLNGGGVIYGVFRRSTFRNLDIAHFFMSFARWLTYLQYIIHIMFSLLK